MTGMDAVQTYADAKSHADVEGALAVCTDDVVIATFPFQITSRGREETRSQLEAFFTVFPDYSVAREGLIEQGDTVVGWGRVSATMSADFGSIRSTGQKFDVPFACVWDIRDGLIACERFYFDLNHLSEGLGVSTDALAQELKGVREIYEAPVTVT